MSFLVNVFSLAAAFVVGAFVRRYFIFSSGSRKTNLPFIKSTNLLFGSNDIIFCHNKVLALNAHDRHKELGPTFGCYFGANLQVFSADPDLIYKICVEDFLKHRNRFFADSLSEGLKASLMEARDDKWQSSRRVIGSVLKKSKLIVDNVDTDIDATITRMLESIDRKIKQFRANNQEPIVDVYQINKNFFMQAILRIVFNTDQLVDFDSDNNEPVEDMYNFINVNYEAVARTCLLIPQLTNLIRPIIHLFEHGKYLARLTSRLEKIITSNANEALGMTNASKLTTIHSLIKSYKRGELDKNQLLGNAIFLMMAGFATSTDAMSALLFELARNQNVQDKLRADLLQYGEKSKFLEQCINETMRLYPGAMPSRQFGEDVYYKDFRLIKDTFLHVDLYTIHRDQKLWGPEADKWNPDNFEPSRVEKFHQAQFIPFGIGPRNCVGYNLARMELNKFTVQLLLRYKFEICPQTQSELEIMALGALPFALPVKGPIPLKVTPTM